MVPELTIECHNTTRWPFPLRPPSEKQVSVRQLTPTGDHRRVMICVEYTFHLPFTAITTTGSSSSSNATVRGRCRGGLVAKLTAMVNRQRQPEEGQGSNCDVRFEEGDYLCYIALY